LCRLLCYPTVPESPSEVVANILLPEKESDPAIAQEDPEIAEQETERPENQVDFFDQEETEIPEAASKLTFNIQTAVHLWFFHT